MNPCLNYSFVYFVWSVLLFYCCESSAGFVQLQSGSMPGIPFLTIRAHRKEKQLCFQWKKASKTHGFFLVAALTTVMPSENTLELIEQEQNMDSDVQGNCGPGYSEDETEIEPKEAKRRMRISKANKGKVPWNKGRKHSPETLARIKERTRQVMKNPKIRLKLSLAQYSRAASESKERKEEIRAILRGAWEVRRKRLLLQKTCLVEWKESVAESARRGGDGEDELHWDSYKTLREDMRQKRLLLQKTCLVEWKESIAESARGVDGEDELHWDSYKTLREDIHQEWLQAVATNKSIPKEHRCRGAAKSAEQKQKIADSIKAKWTDPEYRKKVMTGKQKELKPNRLMARKKCVAMEDRKREKPSRPRNQTLKESSGDRNLKDAREPSIPWETLPPSYSDPEAREKLQMIKQIRSNRAAMEMEKREAIQRAMLLIAEAEKAAKALESAAIGDTVVQAFVLETRRLIDEAIRSMQTAESVKTADAPMSERVFSRPTYTNIQFMDRSEVADPPIADSGDNYGVHQPSLTKSREMYENSHLACKLETPLRSEISKSLYLHSHEPSHLISSPKIGSSEVTGSVNTSIGSELEGVSGDISEEDAMFSAEKTTLTDKQDKPNWKGESMPTENITKGIISSVLHNTNLFLPGINGKSEVTSFQTVKYEKKKKWVRGRLIEVEED